MDPISAVSWQMAQHEKHIQMRQSVLKSPSIPFFFLICPLRSPPAMQGTVCTASAHAMGWDSPTASAFFVMDTGAAQHEIMLNEAFPKQPNNPCLNDMLVAVRLDYKQKKN